MFHPHVHIIIPGGGLTAEHRWQNSRKKFFTPVKVLGKLFRGKFMFLLKQNKERLALGKLENGECWQSLVNCLYAKDWYVYSKNPRKSSYDFHVDRLYSALSMLWDWAFHRDVGSVAAKRRVIAYSRNAACLGRGKLYVFWEVYGLLVPFYFKFSVIFQLLRGNKEKVTEETRYFLTSLSNVADFARAVRAHWGIGNCLHWHLDVTFGEDSSRIRNKNAARVWNVLRKLALEYLKKQVFGGLSLKNLRRLAGWDSSFLEKVIFLR